MTGTESERTARKARRRTWRLAAELLVMVGLLLAIDKFLGLGDGFAHFQPNPYWLPVLVMAVVYGSWAGLVAAGLATAAWLTTNDIDFATRDYFDAMLTVSLPPLLWYTAAVILGEVTDSRKRTMRRLQSAQESGTRNKDRLIDAFDGLAQNNRVLQLRIATEERTVSEALRLAAILPHVTGLERQSILRAMVAMACGTGDFTCYRVQFGRAWPVLFGDDCNRERKPLSENLLLLLRDRRTIMHVANPEDRSLLVEAGLIAVPLPASDGERLEGVLVVHNLPFERLGPHLDADLAALAGWLASFVRDHGMLTDLTVVRESI